MINLLDMSPAGPDPASVRLTEYAHGAGCGCKIAPNVLEKLLTSEVTSAFDPRLLVGNETRDDAAVFDLGDGTALVSTTDFFAPIVDDPTDFGRIASVNALSDVYAMGGTPLMAIAILGWPVNTLPIEAAKLVVDGARMACAEAGIPLAGGHSIDTLEPIFGLAVSGRVQLAHLRTNASAQAGDVLYLTKPLGVGILATAEKNKTLKAEHVGIARDSMVRLNSIGAVFGTLPYVHAITDVTGFGLGGHVIELCQGAQVSAEIFFDAIPRLHPDLDWYIHQAQIPSGTGRNAESYGALVSPLQPAERALLFDPQTSGGLLVAVDGNHQHDFEALARDHGYTLRPIGRITPRTDPIVTLQ